MKKSKASNIATGGILTGLTLVILYLAQIISINTIALLTIASLFVPIGLMRCNLKTAITIYIAASILGCFIIPFDTAIKYILFFGIYGLIKHLAETRGNRILEFIIKLLFFNLALIIYYFIFINFVGNLDIKISIYILIIFAEVGFLIYDYALTLLIDFYHTKIHYRLK